MFLAHTGELTVTRYAVRGVSCPMRRRVKILVVLVSVLGILSDVWASEWFRLNPLDWEASFEFDGSRRSGDA
jgi:hypothetical protein